MAEVVPIVPKERFQHRPVEQIVVVPVSQVVEEQLMAQKMTQT